MSASPDSCICARPFTRTHAFTLIELLTVIAIVGVLTAILFPVLGKIRDSAHATQCSSNLRQIFTYYMLDVQENRGMTPADQVWDPVKNQMVSAPWINRISAKYAVGAESMSIAQIWGCPTQIDLKPGVVTNANNNKTFPLTYSMNRDINRLQTNPYTSTVRALSTFVSPPRTALAGDGNDSDNNASYYTSIIGSSGRPPATPHNGKANILFLDGHVEAVSDQSLLNVPGTPAAGTKQALFWFGQ